MKNNFKVVNDDNYILQTFLALTSKTYPFGTEDSFVEMMIREKIFPDTLQKDEHGNYYYKIGSSRTIFASHLDTACKDQTQVSHVFDGKFIRTDGKTILGADDKAGVTIMLYLIKNNVPGLYYFFVGEEVGCIGSGLAAKFGEFKGKYDRIISFDRKDTSSIITYQSSIRCCSDMFADSLAKEFNQLGMNYSKDEGGVYTDSAEFIDIIPECTNISVGYYREHTTSESQDIEHLCKLAECCIKINWEFLPTKRDVTKTQYRSFDNYKKYSTNSDWSYHSSKSDWRRRDYGYSDDWSYQNGSLSKNSYNDNDDDYWYGQEQYNTYKKNRSSKKRGKTFYDGGGELLEFDATKTVKRQTNQTYYDNIIDKILDSNLTKEEIETVKDQYLDINNENDKEFYEYLLGNVI